MMTQYLYSFPETGAAKYTGRADEAAAFTLRHQLLDAAMWRRFVDVYRENSDASDEGWRNEFWGKTMRGGCLTYRYTGSQALYSALKQSVEDMLTAARSDGSFSTYPDNDNLKGWDVWGRKYVLTGMLHFYKICIEPDLKERIIAAMTAHTSSLIDAIYMNKKDITETSSWWGGVNSCSILESVVELYKLTDKKPFLEFAEYIISTGGCRDGDLIALAAEDKLAPYEYPEVKAYETMSFFEGVLAMYEVTCDKRYLETVEKFASAVKRTDITLIGSAGCTHELFDHSSERQTVFSDGIMQETCVTVTWMRLCARLFMLTGKETYAAEVEHSAFNGLYGAINTHMLPLNLTGGGFVDALPFDSYSPLVNQPRGRGVGGLKYFKNGGFYGCCACIASAGTALLPLMAVTQFNCGAAFNTYLPGTVRLKTPSGRHFDITCKTEYPAKADVKITVTPEVPERFAIRLRVPSFVKDPVILVNGEEVKDKKSDSYVALSRVWNGDTITLSGHITLEKTELNGMTAFVFGALTLARDNLKEPDENMGEPLCHTDATALRADPEEGEAVRFLLPCCDGKTAVLTDYASCGKHWDKKNAAVSVWHKLVSPRSEET